MLFTSTVFLFIFLPLVLVINFLLPKGVRNFYLLLASLFFYAWGELFYAVILLCSIGFNFLLTRAMALAPAGGRKRTLFVFAVVLNLALLVWFRYGNFIIDNLNVVLGIIGSPAIQLQPIHLPIGLAIFTFQALCYVIDIYQGKADAQKRFVNAALYISFFPQLIAGPVIRYRDIANELVHRKVDFDSFAYGVRRFIIGLGKIVILANSLGKAVDMVFSLSPGQWTTPVAWLGVVCFALQIYFYLSGYSDMAIGLGRMLGFHFAENFNYPFIAQSIRDFWQRWYISITTWFREYLYIPLGGSRGSFWRTQMNLWIVFVLCGLWFGARWNVVLCGAIHGLFIVAERRGFDRILSSLWRPLRHVYVLSVCLLTSVFFVTNSLSGGLTCLSAMVGLKGGKISDDIAAKLFSRETMIMLGIGILATFPWRLILAEGGKVIRYYLPGSASGSESNPGVWRAVCGQVGYLIFLVGVLFASLMYIAAGVYHPVVFRF